MRNFIISILAVSFVMASWAVWLAVAPYSSAQQPDPTQIAAIEGNAPPFAWNRFDNAGWDGDVDIADIQQTAANVCQNCGLEPTCAIVLFPNDEWLGLQC